MITVKQARKILGFESRKQSDEQIETLLQQLHLLSEIVISVINSGSKRQLGVIDHDLKKKRK